MESRIIRLIISVILIGSMLITNPTNIFAADIFEDFEGWGFIDADPALSGGAYTYNNWKFIAKLDGVAANDGAIETWTGPAALSITTGYGDVDELHILNSNGDEFNFGGFNFTGSSVRSMFVTGWRDGIQVTEKQFINYTDATADEYFDMRSKDSEFKNVDEIRICGADLGGGNLDIISGYLESLTYDVTPVDEVPPIILGLTMTSDNANVTTVAKVGDQITLSITANENIQSPTVTIAGNTATVSDAGDSDAKTWKATYIMQESDTEGTIPFTLDFMDIANNAAMQVTAVTSGSPVIFDMTPPAAPTAVTVTPVGGTVIANSLNQSNTNMTATATITADDATGGKAELYLDAILIASDSSIVSGDTQVTFDLGTSTNAELQVAVALGGTISVKLYDVAGNSSTSSVGNPTLNVDYIFDLPAPPTATVHPITGTLQIGETLTGHYTYSDVNGDLEGASTYKWYSSDNMAGLNKTVIAGATTKTYVLTSTDIGKYISFEVTPVAATGIAQGIAVESARTGPVVLAEAVPTATVKAITGILQVGETLTGNYIYSDVNGDLEGASTYKWYRADNSAGFNKTEIAGANAKTYVLTSSDEGKYIGFEVTPVALTGITQGTAVLSEWAGAIVPAEAAPTATVQAITGTLQVGETLTGNYTYSDVNGDLEGTSTYKWYRADNVAGLNKTAIEGATSFTYVLVSADLGKYISFEVTPVAATGIAQGTAALSSWTGAIVPAEVAPTAIVQLITGTLQVGATLTGHYTYSDVNGDLEGTSTYKWYRSDDTAGLNKTVIAGATTKTYVLTSGDIGKYISFEVTPVAVTGTLQGIAVESGITGPVVLAEAVPKATVQPITGTLQVGRMLTGHYTYSDVNGDSEGTSIFKWYRADNSSGLNKTEIAGANAKTYVLTSSDEGKYIGFEVTPVALTGITQGTAVLSEWAGAIVPAEAAPTATVQAITGTLQVGETLTGNYTYSDVNGDLEGTSTYKWYRADNVAGLNKTAIEGATSFTYVLVSADLGKYISFEVTPVAATGIAQGTAVLSAWAGIIAPAEAEPTATVQPITGTLQVGETLTGHYTYSDINGDLEGTSTYKWYRADNASGLNKAVIAGANAKNYVLTSADEGKYISFEVTPVAATGITQGIAVESGRIGPVAVVLAEAAPTATVQPITGILKVGETLTGHYTYSDVNGDLEGNSIYKWYRADDMEGRNKTVIVGARTTTYVLTSADEGKYICFEVTPVAATGIAQGIAIESVRTGVVGKKAGQSGGGGSSYSPNPVITPTIDILINNDKVNYATSEIKMENGRKKTTIQLDDEKLTAKLNTENVGSTIIIPVYNNSDIVIGQLNGQTVKNMQDKDATLEIKTENVTYTIPAAAINIGSISERIGSQVQLKDIKVNISISNSSKETITKVETSAKMNKFQLVVHPTDFEITCTNGSKTLEVSRFNHYVERTVLLPKGVDPNQITTGVVLNKDGTFTHVPTVVKFVDGRYYAKINSLTNSTYTVIWNPVTFKDVEKHWAKDYVNDVGSRLIDDGVGNGNFAPNRDITRAEFASMVVKALGLKGTNFPEKFGDVNKGDSYYYSIYTAYEYGILTGYSNGNFGPQDLITREQAMTMLAKAMEIVDLNVTVSDADVSNQLKLFKDSDSISLYARQAATICVKNGIFAGDNKGKLTPKDNLTRAESATIIIKLLKKAELI